MTALGVELRRGAGAPLFVVLVVLGLVGGWESVAVPPAIWPLVVSSLGWSVTLMGPVAGGIAAFAAARVRRRRTGYLEDVSSRGSAAAGLVQLIGLLVWTAAAYLAVVAVLFGYAATSATWSGPDVLRTCAAGVGLLLHVVLGFLAGRVVPRRFTPLLVVFALYGVVTFFVGTGIGARFAHFMPADVSLYDQFNVLNVRVAPGQLLWYVGVGLALTAAWVWSRQRTPAPARVLGAGLVLAALGAVVLVPQQGRTIVGGAVRTEWTCTEHTTSGQGPTTSVCLHPALSTLMPQVSAELMPIADRLSGTPFEVRRFEQRPRGVGQVPTPGAIAFALDDGRQSSLDLLRPDAAVNALVVGDACFHQETGAGDRYSQLVGAWVAGDPDLFVPFTDAEERAQQAFEALDPDQTRAWLDRHEAEIRGCVLTAADF